MLCSNGHLALFATIVSFLEKRMLIKRCHPTQRTQRLHGILKRRQLAPQPQKKTGTSSESLPRIGPAPQDMTPSNSSTSFSKMTSCTC